MHQFSSPYSPHQNGTAERGWGTLFNATRCVLLQADLPKDRWNYVVRHIVSITNRYLNRSLKLASYGIFSGKKSNLGELEKCGLSRHSYFQIKSKLNRRAIEGKKILEASYVSSRFGYATKINIISTF